MDTHNTLLQRREARGEPEKDVGYGTEGQGKNRADDRRTRPIQARRAKDDMGEGQRVRTCIVIPSELYQLTHIYTGTLAGYSQSCSQGTSPSCSLQTGKT